MNHPSPRVLVVVFDGLRPDLATPDRMPALSAFLAAAGTTRFGNASSVYPSITRVCATALGTSLPPALNGVVHNGFPDPAVEGRFLDTSRAEDVRAAIAHHGPGFVGATRFADVLAAAGLRLALVHSGSAGGALLLDPRARTNRSFVFSPAGRDASETPEAWDAVTARLGPPPADAAPRVAMMAYAARALVEVAIPEARADVAMLWLNEPDTSFHYVGLDEPGTRDALRAADEAFAAALGAVGEGCAVLALSDHGHVSTTRQVRPVELFASLGLDAAVGARGGDVSVYACTTLSVWPTGPDPARMARLAHAAMERDWCGGVFAPGGDGAAGPHAGTLDLALLSADHPVRAPSLVIQLANDDAADPWGLPGTGTLGGDHLPHGGGMHGGLHRAEMANLVALRLPARQGPAEDARRANLLDVAPTILGALGLPPAPGMAGHDLAGPAMDRPARVVEARHGGFAQALAVHGTGPGAVIERGWRVA